MRVGPLADQALSFGDLSQGHLGYDPVTPFGGPVVTAQAGDSEPHLGQSVVLRHALAVSVQVAKYELRLGISLLGGPTIPYHGLGKVPRHAPTVVVPVAESVLRGCVSLLGGLALDIVLRLVLVKEYVPGGEIAHCSPISG